MHIQLLVEVAEIYTSFKQIVSDRDSGEQRWIEDDIVRIRQYNKCLANSKTGKCTDSLI